jgi:DNA polymerase IV
MNPKIIAHVDLDAFFASVEQRDRPELKGKPVVVGADPKKGKGRGVVSTCSYEARRYGIHSAMPISEAYRRCPQAVFLPVDFSKYHAVAEQVLKIIYDFTPEIERVSVDEAFLDITGSYHLHKTPRQLGLNLKERIKQETGVTASVGIAPVKMVAKIASAHCKPDGLCEVKEDQVLGFLWPLSIDKLWGVGPKTRESLNHLGIQTIGDLAKVEPAALVERFGEHGFHLSELARGIDPRPVELESETKSVSHEHTFDVDTGNVEAIAKVLLYLSEKLSFRLRQDNLKGKTLTVKIRLSGFKTYTRAFTFPERTNYTDTIYKKAKAIFDDFFKKGMTIRLIGVRISNFEDPYARESLFEDPVEVKKEQIHKVVDSIKIKFGEKAIHRAI